MPRAAATRPVDTDAPSGASGIEVRLGPAELKLRAELQKHERLLRDIEKKKLACQRAAALGAEAAARVADRADRLRAAYQVTLEEIRCAMEGLLGDESPLGKRDKTRVRRVYRQVVPAEDLDDEAGDPARAADPFGSECDEPGRPDPRAEAGPSAPKPSGDRALSLKALFRRLATALHPDKVQDENDKQARTAVMKEVTRAYETGDLARLVELDRDWLAAPTRERDDEATAQHLAELIEKNRALRRQLRELTAELKNIKASYPETSPRARSRRAGPGLPSMDLMLDQLERELAYLKSFRDQARMLEKGEIEVADFVSGPPSDEDPMDSLLNDMLSDLLEQAFCDPEPPRPPRRKTKRQRAR